MKLKVPKKYEVFYHAVVAWNHDKNWQTFKNLWCNCCASWVPIWSPERLWFIVKDTVTGVYKNIETDFQNPDETIREWNEIIGIVENNA